MKSKVIKSNSEIEDKYWGDLANSANKFGFHTLEKSERIIFNILNK